MSTQPGVPDAHSLLELRGLIAAMCEAQLTPLQVARLEELICGDAACAAYYVSAMSVYAALPRYVGVTRPSRGAEWLHELQTRDTAFWNDVITAAATLDSVTGSDHLAENHRPTLPMRRPVESTSHSSLLASLNRAVGTRAKSAWVVLFCATVSLFAAMLGWGLWAERSKQPPQPANFAGSTSPNNAAPRQAPVVARVGRVRQAQWGVGQRAIAPDSALHARQRIVLAAGVIEIVFASGASIAAEGPCELEVLTENEGYLRRGRMVADVPPAARGFAIATAGVRVVDMGTRFGLEVDDRANANMTVLNGVVEATLADRSTRPARVEANQAVHYDASTNALEASPANAVPFDAIESRLNQPVITQVKASSGKPYTIVSGGIHEDSLAYIDRIYEWNSIDAAGIPAELQHAEYVQTSNNDDLTPDFTLELSFAEPADLFVLFDDRARVPDWLARDFVDTGADIGLDTGNQPQEYAKGPRQSVDVRFSIWKRHVERGSVTLGATAQRNVAHYGIAVLAK